MSDQSGNEPNWPPPQPGPVPSGRPPGYSQQPPGYPQQPVGQPGWGQGPGASGWTQRPGPGGPHQDAPNGGQYQGSSVEIGSVRSGAGWGRLALVGTVLVVAVAAGFAIWRALSGPSGPATPEEAAARLFESGDQEDLLGIIEVMLPSERESLVEPTTDLVGELVRLEVLSDRTIDDDGALAGTSGVTFDFPEPGQPGELAYEIAPLGGSETVQWVTVTGGTATVTFDPAVARDGLGAALLDRFGDDLGEDLEPQIDTVDFAEELARGEPLEFAVVEEDGGWYFSVWYTVAGLASDGRGPDHLAAPTPNGADSPEEAAAQFLRSAIELDVAGAMSTLDPEEFRALYDYWGHVGPDVVEGAQQARREAADGGFDWSVESVSASSEERDGRTVATFDELAVRFTSTAEGAEADLVASVSADGLSVDGTLLGAPLTLTVDQDRVTGQGTIEGDAVDIDVDLRTYEGHLQIGPDRLELSREGDCLVLSADGERELLCDEDLGLNGSSAALDIEEDWQAIGEGARTPGLTMVERDGRWYVSGFPTWIYAMTDVLAVIDREQFDELLDSSVELLDDLSRQPTF